MSRRRKRSDRDVVEFRINIVCTGRGTHRRVELERLSHWAAEHSVTGEAHAEVDRHSDDLYFVEVDRAEEERWRRDPVGAPPLPHKTLTRRCRLCPTPTGTVRTVSLRQDTLDRITTELRHADKHDLDISYLSAML